MNSELLALNPQAQTASEAAGAYNSKMANILIFTVIGSVLFIGAYYLLVQRYYWGPKRAKEVEQERQAGQEREAERERERQAKERDA